MEFNLEHLNQWLGKEHVAEAVISIETANLMNATLNRKPTFKAGDDLPPAWHWLYFHEPVLGNELGVEGHAQLGGFMPPVSFGDDVVPRRMWAGGKLEFGAPIRLLERATKRATIKSITPKQGRSGALCFIVVEHEVSVAGERRLLEQQTIVYRQAARAEGNREAVAPAAPTDDDFSARYTPDSMLLFRYSALTFNAHRIHYDLDFCRNHEGYPNLVVHGPLTATFLLDLFYHQFPDRRIVGFEYRGQSPLFIPHHFTINGKANGDAWASNHAGGLAMSATVSLA